MVGWLDVLDRLDVMDRLDGCEVGCSGEVGWWCGAHPLDQAGLIVHLGIAGGEGWQQQQGKDKHAHLGVEQLER